MLQDKNGKLFTLAIVAGVAFSLGALLLPPALPIKGHLIADLDTPYKRVWVFDTLYGDEQRPARILTDTIFGGQSGMYLDDPTELVFAYQTYFDLAEHFNPSGQKALMIGAGAYTYPVHYLKGVSERTIDVVEIDPALEGVAKTYFGAASLPGLSIINEDGRTYLNHSNKIYDTILVDAFNSLLSIPHQLTTTETVSKLYERLTDSGVVVVNIISAIEGSRGDFLRAEYATYKLAFPTVLVFKVHEGVPDTSRQNLILVALKGESPKLTSTDPVFKTLLKTLYTKPIAGDVPPLSDGFAPVEKYNAKMML